MLSSPGLSAEESLLFDGPWEYLTDHGATFAQRENGLSYGWSTPQATGNAQTAEAPSEKYDTYVVMPAGAEWEMAVPDGTYRVLVVAGDPVSKDAHCHLLVEGQAAIDATASGRKYWQTGHVEVTVSDGRLTLRAGEKGRNNHLLYLHVYSPMYGHHPEPRMANLPLRVNCAGPAIDGFRADQKWTDNADFGFIPVDEDGLHRWQHDTGDAATYCALRAVDFHELPASVKITGTHRDAVHRTHISQRGSDKGAPGPGFIYQVRVPEGVYDLTVLVTNLKEERPTWNDFDLHVEDRVVAISPGTMTSAEHEAATVTIEAVLVTDGILTIRPIFTGWGYSWGASMAGFIVQESGDRQRRIEIRPPGPWALSPADGEANPNTSFDEFSDLDAGTTYRLLPVANDG